MKFIAHRGFWMKSDQKNSLEAFEHALRNGFGIETDFRDRNGQLVVSHDIPTPECVTAFDFFRLCLRYENTGPLALNVKADGLQNLFREELKALSGREYFLFDMSIPDTVLHLKASLPVYVRASEYERPSSVLLEKAKGVWLDCFESDWFSIEYVMSLLSLGKFVCLVSPELHGRAHEASWRLIRSTGLHNHNNFYLCTDFPDKACQELQ